jgi:hypothetical protein
MTTIAPALTELYDAYTTAASTTDAARRLELLRACAVEDLEIISPFPYAVTGIDAVSEQLGKVAGAMPDGRLTIRRTSAVDAHHGIFRVTFENCSSDGTRLSAGMHVVEVRDDRIARILVFVPDMIPADDSAG